MRTIAIPNGSKDELVFALALLLGDRCNVVKELGSTTSASFRFLIASRATALLGLLFLQICHAIFTT